MQGLPLFAARRRNVFLYVCAIALPLLFLTAMLSQSVFAQNTFVIKDGEKVIVHTTFASDPARALNEAGVEADPDEYHTTMTEEGVYDVTIQRDDTVTVVAGGKEHLVTIADETVGQMLDRIGIPMGEEYELSCAETETPVDGMVITVDHVVTNKETYTVETPFAVSYVQDPYLPEGEEQILTKGVAGQTLYTAMVDYRNASVVDRRIIHKEELRAPQMQIVARGTGEMVGKTGDAPLIGDGIIALPTGEVLTYYKQDTFSATAYTQYDAGCDGVTACQTPVRWGVVAVDPTVIPYGTRMFIVDADGDFVYGLATAEDCGSAIQGKELDLYMHTLEEAFDYGRQDVTVYFLGDANWTF